MRKGEIGAVLLAMLIASGGAVASAHPAREFRACTRYLAEQCTDRGAAFVYGDTVIVRGRVSPTHERLEARVLRRDPHSDGWNRVATVRITSRGNMRFLWETRRADAVQDAPYLFRFKIPGHGRSNVTEAFVLFGE